MEEVALQVKSDEKTRLANPLIVKVNLIQGKAINEHLTRVFGICFS